MNRTLAVYIHWPFCLAKCPYCDFNSHVAEEGVDETRWRAALIAEMDHFAGQTVGRRVSSIFFGGGTPSLMAPETVAGLIEAVGGFWPLADDMADDLEVTLEANPTSVEAGAFAAVAEAGVNRLSLGVQSLDDRALGFLGRGHSAAEALAALEVARSIFPRISFDLIYALPEQTVADWRHQLGRALELADDHLSLYQLTIEAGTPFARNRVSGAAEETAADLYETTREMTAAAGLGAYEISNHARPGGACRHNLTYWRGGDYVGIGPGAHGRLTVNKHERLTVGATTEAPYQIADPARWLAAVEARGHGTAKRRALSPGVRREELIMTGLRLTDGIDRARFHALVGMEPEDAMDPGGLGRMVEAGFMETDQRGVRATADGLMRLNGVLGALLA